MIRYAIALMLMCSCASGQVAFLGTAEDSAYFPSLNVTTAVTFSAWVNGSFRVAANDGCVAAIGYSVAPRILFFLTAPTAYRNYNSFGYTLIDGAAGRRVYSASSVPSNAWTHLAVTYSSSPSNDNIYFNGVLQTNVFETISNPATIANSEQFLIGMQNPAGASDYVGIIDDIRIYNRILTHGEINEIYNRSWSLADDRSLVLRSLIATNETGSATGVAAKNYGVGTDGIYSNSPTAAEWIIQHEKPRHATINID